MKGERMVYSGNSVEVIGSWIIGEDITLDSYLALTKQIIDEDLDLYGMKL